jgi:hypothetical protein
MFLFSRLKTSVEQQEWQLLQFPLQDFLSSFLSLWQDFFQIFLVTTRFFCFAAILFFRINRNILFRKNEDSQTKYHVNI